MNTTMKAISLILVSIIFSSNSYGLDSIIAKGSKYKVYDGDILISEHNTEYKAIESAVKYANENCVAKCEIEVIRNLSLVVSYTPESNPEEITLKWDLPTEREDGSDLSVSELKKFLIQREIEGEVVETIIVDAPKTSVVASYAENSKFRIATVDTDNLLGNFGDWVEIE